MSFSRSINTGTNGPAGSATRSLTVTGSNQASFTAVIPPTIAATANAGTEVITATAHGLVTGSPFQFAAVVSGTNPSGVSLGVVYYAIRVGNDSLKAAATVADAFNGVAINLTAAGTNFAIMPIGVFPVDIPVQFDFETPRLKWLSVRTSSGIWQKVFALDSDGRNITGSEDLIYPLWTKQDDGMSHFQEWMNLMCGLQEGVINGQDRISEIRFIPTGAITTEAVTVTVEAVWD